jgi:adenine-specific DNA glycosylase
MVTAEVTERQAHRQCYKAPSTHALEFISNKTYREIPRIDIASAHRALSNGEWRWSDGVVRHVFTHFALELQVAVTMVKGRPLKDALWVPIGQLGGVALPSLMRKVAKLGLTPARQSGLHNRGRTVLRFGA